MTKFPQTPETLSLTGSAIFQRSLNELRELAGQCASLAPRVDELGQAMLDCWSERGKLLVAGNGGSAADAMHFAEELIVRFSRNRRALAAIALCDPTVLTCAGNDFGYDQVFARQVEGLGNPNDMLIVMSTSGNSLNLALAVQAAKKLGVRTVALIGKDGGKLRGQCDIEIIVPSSSTARIQEMHKVLFHSLCEWVDQHFTAHD